MKYDDLLKAHSKYGTTDEDIRIKKGYQEIQENVVIAPWWDHTIFEGRGFEIVQTGEKVYNFYSNELLFSYIELKRIGAPAIMDFILSLGVTKCKNIIFLGSVGSLNENIKIGDIVIPEYSVCGDGASRYLNSNFEDEFLKKQYPTKEYTENLLKILEDKKVIYHYVPNFSIDTVFAQFYHINKILETGAQVIEMETANIFKCNQLLNLNMTALFCVSDNTVLNKSLYSGRIEEEDNYRRKIRNEVIPEVVIELFKKTNKI